MDTTKFFDKINHDLLMTKIGDVNGDKAVGNVSGKFLRTGAVRPAGPEVSSEKGTP